MLTRLGGELIDMGVVRDEPAALERAFAEAAASADAIVTSGGVSVGEADFTRELLGELGEVLFWKIAMKPGRPMAYGRIGGAHFFGLPGNPVAVMVTFYEFVRDALLALAGRTDDCALPLRPGAAARPRYGRSRAAPSSSAASSSAARNGEWTARMTGSQGSGVLRSMSEANCFIVLEHERGDVEAGRPRERAGLRGPGLAHAVKSVRRAHVRRRQQVLRPHLARQHARSAPASRATRRRPPL